MAFDADKFSRAKLEPRRTSVPVPALAVFFADGEDAVWQVRGLSAVELHKALEAGKRQGTIESIVKAVSQNGDQAAAVRRALGLDSGVPGEIAKRLEMLVMGSLAPVIDLPTAVKLGETFPVEFLQLTNEITELTGKGADLGKVPAASPQTPA